MDIGGAVGVDVDGTCVAGANEDVPRAVDTDDATASSSVDDGTAGVVGVDTATIGRVPTTVALIVGIPSDVGVDADVVASDDDTLVTVFDVDTSASASVDNITTVA